MTYDDKYIITIATKEDVDDYIELHADYIINHKNGLAKEISYEEFKKYGNDKVYLNEQRQRCYKQLEEYDKYSFVLKTGYIVSVIKDGKLITILP